MIRTAQQIHAEPHILKDLWGTPDHIYDRLFKMFSFNLDPCCTIETAKCNNFYTPKENGLVQDWNGFDIFVNPPYSRGNIDLWVKRCYIYRNVSNIVALLPVSTSADWFQKYCLGQTIYWVDKRVQFVGATTKAPFSSMIVHFNGRNKNLTFKQ